MTIPRNGRLWPRMNARSSSKRRTRTCGHTGRPSTACWSTTARAAASAPPRTTAISRCSSTGRSRKAATAASTCAARPRSRSGTPPDAWSAPGRLRRPLQQPEEPAAIPSKAADKPVGEWNTFRIIMVGEKVTVYLNGELVVDNVVLENYWNRSKPIYPTGQIELQNHSSLAVLPEHLHPRDPAPPRRSWKASCRCSTAGTWPAGPATPSAIMPKTAG